MKMEKGKLLNLLFTLILVTINVLITKYVLNQLGEIWDINTFKEMDWRIYWAFSSIAGIYILGRAVELEILKRSVDEIRDKGKSWGDYETTYRQLTYIVSIFLMLFFSWGINQIFF